MNPELQRNIWLELTPRRAALMVLVPALIFLAVGSIGRASEVALASEYFFYAVVVLWGAREAAQSVVGEIRDRTWDTQRLSALTPFAMTWGKLLGATCYIWLGGLFSLAVLFAITFETDGAATAFFDLGYFLTVGFMAHAAALFASLLAVRRRQPHWRFEIFFYQLAGWLAAWAARSSWQIVLQNRNFEHRLDLTWWGFAVDERVFYLVSVLAFLGWMLAGCYRLMRTELQVRNGPYVWLGFIVYMAIYVAGFDSQDAAAGFNASLADHRLALAAGTLATLTYLAVTFEPKDRVLYRWLLEKLAARQYTALVPRLQGWMTGYGVCFFVAIILAIHLGSALSFTVLAMLGFITRDIGIFLLFPLLPGPRRGDMTATVVVLILYTVLPELLRGIGVDALAKLLFTPFAVDAGLLAPAIAWAEAIGVWLLVFSFGRVPKPEAGPIATAPNA